MSIDANMLENLPVFDNDYIATMSRFLDAGSLGNAGVTIVVNGMEVNALNVSAAAVQRIRINQDPYSAEYSRPGRGRVEILTKPGGREYHGDVNTVFRDAHLERAQRVCDDTTAGATPARRRILRRPARLERQDIVHAVGERLAPGSAGIHLRIRPERTSSRTQCLSRAARALVSGSITHQISDQNTFSIRPAYQYESDENRGAGGTTLASAATTFKHHEQQVTYTQQTVVRPTLLNQFQVLVGHEREPTTSATPDPAIVVAGCVHRRRRAGRSASH